MRFGRITRSMLRVVFARGMGGILGIGVATLIANRLGASAPSDAFYLIRRVTLGITEAVNRLVVIVYVPPIVVMLRANRDRSMKRYWVQQIGRIFVTVTALAVLMAVLAGWIVILIAPGFDAERQELSVVLLRVLVFAIPVHVILAALASVSYAFRRFFVPEFAAIAPRLLTIIVLFLFVPPLSITALGWAVLAGTAVGVMFLVPSVAVALSSDTGETGPAAREDRAVGNLSAEAQNEPGFRSRILPVMSLLIYRQVASWIDLAFASMLVAGAVSIIEFGQRLAFFVPTLLMNSFFTVFYTELAHDAVEGGMRGLTHSVAASMRVGLFVLIPFAVFLWTASGPLVDLVFQHGAFDAAAARETTTVMQIFAPAFVIVFVMRMLTMGAYADTGAPHLRMVALMIGTGLVVRIAALSVFPAFIGVAGIPSAVLLSSAAICATAYYLLTQRWGRILRKSDILALGKFAVGAAFAWLGMLGVAYAAAPLTDIGQIILIVALATVGAVMYLLATTLLGTGEARLLYTTFLRRRSRTG